MKYSSIIRIFASFIIMTISFSCKDPLTQNEGPQTDDVLFQISVDKLTIATADLRIRHDGDQDVKWVYHYTSDLEVDPDELIESLVSGEIDFAGQIPAYSGNNRSIRISGLLPKTPYCLIVKAIDESGMLYGKATTFFFRTQRDLDVFEVNNNWNIEYQGRTEGIDPGSLEQVEYENFKCTSTDEEPYIMALIKQADYKAMEKNPDHELKLRTFFEQYVASAGIAENKWGEVIETGDCIWQEQRLRHGDWMVFMVGVDEQGELTGLYRQVDTTILEEEPVDDFNRWLGTWEVTGYNDGVQYKFNLSILSAEANMWYYSVGWEPNNVYAIDPAILPVEIFYDKTTGNAYLVSQYVTTAIDGYGSEMDFYFYGTFPYGGSYSFVDMENSRIAELTMTDSSNTEAKVTGMVFNTSQAGVQLSFEYTQVIYYMTNGSNGTAISMGHPKFPFTMKKISE